MSDLVWIVLDIVCLIAFIYFTHCENKNTKVRKEQIKELKKQNKMLDKIIKRGGIDENKKDN